MNAFKKISTISNFSNSDSRIGTFEVLRSSPSPKVSIRQLTKSSEGCHAPLRGIFGPLENIFLTLKTWSNPTQGLKTLLNLGSCNTYHIKKWINSW